MIWASASRIKAWYACPRRAKLEKFVETPAMRAGTERHALIELMYRRADLSIPADAGFTDECKSIVAKALERRLLPPPDQVVSCEAADIPAEFKYSAYGRSMFQVPMSHPHRGPPWGIRGAADLVFLEDDDPDTLWIGDWKARSQDDGEIQGSCYALAYSTMFPGFRRYVFQQRSLTLSWPHDTYEFLADDMDKVSAFIEALVYAMTDDTIHAPRENKWCAHCTVSAECPVYQLISAAPIVESLPAVKSFDLPTEFGVLVALQEKAATYEKIAEAMKDRCREALFKILEHGPMKHEGKTYSKGTGTSGYEIKPGRDIDVIRAIEAGNGKVEDFLVFDVPRVREALKSFEGRAVLNDLQDLIKHARSTAFEAKTYPKIIRKAG